MAYFVFILAALDAVVTPGFGGEILLRSTQAPAVTGVQTWAGQCPVRIRQVEPPKELTLLVVADAFPPDSTDSLVSNIDGLWTKLHQTNSIRLGILGGGIIQFAGPFGTRSKLSSALRELKNVLKEPRTPADATAFVSELAGAAHQLGANWSAVELIGDLPPLDRSAAEYAVVLLLRAFTGEQVSLSWVGGDRADLDTWRPLFIGTGGMVLHELSDIVAVLTESSWSYFDVSWDAGSPKAGFVLGWATLDGDGTLPKFPDVTFPANAAAPTISQWLELRQLAASLTRAASQGSLSPQESEQFHSTMEHALEINARDPETLGAGARIYESVKDYKTAAALLSKLVEVTPTDARLFDEMGQDLFYSSQSEQAEGAFLEARNLGVKTPSGAESLARIHLARKDDTGALPFLAELLDAQPNRADIWFMQGESAGRLKQSELLFKSWERGLKLDESNIPYRTALIAAYVESNRREDCLRHIHAVTSARPADAAVRATYAGFLDRLEVNAEALAAWRSVLQIDPNSETAWYRVGRLSLAAHDTAAALEASDSGIQSHPDSARLYILKADAHGLKGEDYQARATLAIGRAKVKDLDLYRRSAEEEDGFSGSAAPRFHDYAELLAASGARSQEIVPALERGLELAVRANDVGEAAWFVEKLGGMGQESITARYVKPAADSVSLTMLPGGIDGLAFIARTREHTTPDRFFIDYCQTIANTTAGSEPKAGRQYLEDIEDYFRKLAELEAYGKRENTRSIVVVSVRDKRSRQSAEKILELFGLRLHSSHGEITIEEMTKGARKQDLAGALAVDGGSIAKTLNQGKDYRIEIPYEAVPVWPEEKLWRDAFYAKEKFYGGLAQALAHMPRLAHLYTALSALDRPTLDALLAASSLNVLYAKHVELLAQYSTALSVHHGVAVFPGDGSEQVWSHLVGASPKNPPAFFRALIEKDDGRLLSFFFALSQLDQPHQRFFTLNDSRAGRFYELFSASAEGQKTSSVVRDASFTDFLRDIPLDGDGHVDFPGSAEVWMVAEGGSPSDKKTAKLLKKVSRSVAPEQEDKVLVRLVKTRDKAELLTEINNFLAVSRIDSHRSEPLDEEAALLLAQRFGAWSSRYPYLTTLTGVNTAQLRSFFSALDKIAELKNAAINPVIGEFEALMELLCLLQRRAELTESQAASLLGEISGKFANATTTSVEAAVAAESITSILSHCRSAGGDHDLDRQIRAALLGEPHAVQAGFGERSVTLDPIGVRHRDFDRVFQMQKAPALGPLLAINAIALEMKGGATPSASEIKTLQSSAAKIPSLAPEKEMKLAGWDKSNFRLYGTAGLAKIVAQIEQRAVKKKSNPKEFQKLGEDLLAEEQPQFTLALCGLIYGYYLRPADLPVSEDVLLLRKHHFIRSSAGMSSLFNIRSAFMVESEGAGSYFTGSFSTFSGAAGQAAAVGIKVGKGVSSPVIAAQIAAIRDTDWDRLSDSDQRLFNLRVQLGREWITLSAGQPDVLAGLARQTAGLLSPSRRSELLSAIEARFWPRVWDTVTISDLYNLGLGCAIRCAGGVLKSPVATSLKHALSLGDGRNIDLLGPVLSTLYGCSHPHMLQTAPYEHYARHMFPTDIAERSAEFKLHLALAGDQAGISPAALGAIAEPLLRDVLAKTEMSAPSDWRSLLKSCTALDAKHLWEKLEAQ